MSFAKSYYFEGNYNLAAMAEDDPIYRIAGLVFAGMHSLARNLFQTHQDGLSADDLIFVQFHIGISFVRTSEYSDAKKYFIENLKLTRNLKVSPLSKFLSYQGLGFYRFFFSNHKKSLYWAEKGYFQLISDSESEALFYALNLELIGHNLIQIGKIRRGLLKLKEAYLISKNSKLNQLKNDIYTSLITYKSDYDLNIGLSIKKLSSFLNKSKSLSDYSKSGLVLQIAKLKIFMGDFLEANSFLIKNFDSIYSYENKRRIAALNTLMADLLFKKGQHLEAFSLTKVARKNLDERIDIGLLLPILFLEIKILKQLNQPNEELINYTKKLIPQASKQHLTREFNRNQNFDSKYELGEDMLGDLLDEVHLKKETAYNAILDYQILSLIPKFHSLSNGKKHILLVEDKKDLFTIDDVKNEYHGSLTHNEMNIIKHITSKGVSKKFLIENIWGYQYDQQRHDTLLHSALSRIKRKLKTKKSWIYGDDNQYFCQDNIIVTIKSVRQSFDDTKTSGKPKSFEKIKIIDSNLNYRQLQILNMSSPPLSVSEYADIWNITRMTALRDLKELCLLNYVTKTGCGKATRYFVTSVAKLQ